MITCNACGFENPNDLEFCECCGAELESNAPESTDSSSSAPDTYQPEPLTVADTFVPDSYSVPEETVTPPSTPDPTPSVPQPTITASTVRLVAKQSNAPIPEFPIDGAALIGIFDPDMGPVDVDLEDFVGNETVSRHHAEIYPENGSWKIKDLGSTNGVFIKPLGQTRFGARITTPESLNPGDEVAIAKIRFLFQSP